MRGKGSPRGTFPSWRERGGLRAWGEKKGEAEVWKISNSRELGALEDRGSLVRKNTNFSRGKKEDFSFRRRRSYRGKKKNLGERCMGRELGLLKGGIKSGRQPRNLLWLSIGKETIKEVHKKHYQGSIRDHLGVWGKKVGGKKTRLSLGGRMN